MSILIIKLINMGRGTLQWAINANYQMKSDYTDVWPINGLQRRVNLTCWFLLMNWSAPMRVSPIQTYYGLIGRFAGQFPCWESLPDTYWNTHRLMVEICISHYYKENEFCWEDSLKISTKGRTITVDHASL